MTSPAVHNAVEAGEPDSVRKFNLNVVFLTNVIAPYWKPVFASLAQRFRKFRVLISTRSEPNRTWQADWAGFDVVLQRSITFKRTWRHPDGFRERAYIHWPFDTLGNLFAAGADVVVSSEMGIRTLAALVYRKLRPHSRLVVWADVSEATEQGRGWMRGIVRRALRSHVDAVVVLGNSGERYLRSLGFDARRIFKVPYATDVALFGNASIWREAQAAHRLLYVGQLIERKGLVPFIASLSKWASVNSHRIVEFSVVGDGPLRGQLEGLSLPSNVRLNLCGTSAYQELARVYAGAGIFVFPTLADCWGVVVNEAMASGLPVLGSAKSQAVEELVEPGRSGWIFRPDPDDTYRVIEECMQTGSEALNAMREQARSTAIRLTPDFIAGLIEDVIVSCSGRAVENAF